MQQKALLEEEVVLSPFLFYFPASPIQMLHSAQSSVRWTHRQEAIAALAVLAVLANASNNYVFCPLDTSTNKRIVLNVIFMTLYPVSRKIEPC